MKLVPDAPTFVAGHRGLAGSAIVRRLRAAGFTRVIERSRSELDLMDRDAVRTFFGREQPAYVFIAAGKVGGIAANMAQPVEFLLDNLRIQNNLLEACRDFGTAKTVFLGSSCIYPREAPQPMSESQFMRGPLEPTNESYAVAKIAGIRLAQALHEQNGLSVVCPMPCNLYGPGDHFDFSRSHVISALVRRLREATERGDRSVTLWGTGNARREFLHVDDCADACLFLLEHFESPELINVGSGEDWSIRELAGVVAEVVGYTGGIEWNTSKPDGMPRKLLDVSKMHALGWRHQIGLPDGLRMVLADFQRWQRAGRGAA